MAYPGGKNGSGVYQAIINEMPPHQVYLEMFLGGGAIMRKKRPAAKNIGLDVNPNVAADFAAACNLPAIGGDASQSVLFPELVASAVVARSADGAFEIHVGDAIAFLEQYQFDGSELIYCDPPYLHSTRKVLDLYADEMSDADHARLLASLARVPCKVMLSGYWNDLYAAALAGWRHIQFQATTRAGPATETLWMNFDEALELHDYGFLGVDYRDRERIKKKITRQIARLKRMSRLERQALLGAIREAWPDQ